MTIGTTNPIPSSTAQDVRFNAEKLDEIINSDEFTYTDRLGTKRLTAKGIQNLIEEAMGTFNLIDGTNALGMVNAIADLATLKPKANLLIRTKGALSAYDGGSAVWVFSTQDQSANVSAYPRLWVAPSYDLTGKSGAWRLDTLDELPAIAYGCGISTDPVVNKEILEQLVASNKGYKKVKLPARVIFLNKQGLVFNYNPNMIGTFGAIAGVTGGTGTVLYYSDADDGESPLGSCFTVTPASGTTRVTGLYLKDLQLISKECWTGGASSSSPRAKRVGMDLNYCGGKCILEDITILGFTQGFSGNELWENRITGLKLRFCSDANGTVPALWCGSKASDNTNNTKFIDLHIESSPNAMQVDKLRHCNFYGGKIECSRAVDATHSVVGIGESAQEVHFHGTMFVTTATTLTHFMINKGKNVTINSCTFDSTAISASVPYSGVRWYKGDPTSTQSGCSINAKFTRVLPSDGVDPDTYPIIVGDYEAFTGVVEVDTSVTSSAGTSSITNAGIVSLGKKSIVHDIEIAPNTNTKLKGPVIWFRGAGSVVKSVRTVDSQPMFTLAGGPASTMGNNKIESYNNQWLSTSGGTVDVTGKTAVFMGAAGTVTGLVGMIGQQVTITSYVAGSTLTHSSTFIMASAANLSMVANRPYTFVCIGAGKWSQIGS